MFSNGVPAFLDEICSIVPSVLDKTRFGNEFSSIVPRVFREKYTFSSGDSTARNGIAGPVSTARNGVAVFFGGSLFFADARTKYRLLGMFVLED